MLFKNLHKILFFFSFFIYTIEAEDIYKVEVIIIKFNDVTVNEKFNNNLDFSPATIKNEYTYHHDQENNLSLYLNIYESRYLHLNLKAFVGQLDFDETITEFIDEDRRVKNSEISYFDHPSMGIIIKIDET